jgi:hypothetical protein
MRDVRDLHAFSIGQQLGEPVGEPPEDRRAVLTRHQDCNEATGISDRDLLA